MIGEWEDPLISKVLLPIWVENPTRAYSNLLSVSINDSLPYLKKWLTVNDLMRGSYAMLDALGRFYSNVNGGHSYGLSILDVGVKTAWEQNSFLEDRFHNRGGIYEWSSKNVKLPIMDQSSD